LVEIETDDLTQETQLKIWMQKPNIIELFTNFKESIFYASCWPALYEHRDLKAMNHELKQFKPSVDPKFIYHMAYYF
jgi:hypothetical protein